MQYLALTLLLLSWLNPLHIGPWISWHNEVLAFAAACLVPIASLCKLGASAAPLRVPYSAFVWLALAVVVVLQATMGQIDFFGDAVVLIFYLGLIFVTTVSGFTLGAFDTSADGEPRVLIRLATVIVLGAALSSVIAFSQTLDVWLQSGWISRSYGLRRPGGNIAQPNQLATLQLMGIVSLNYLFNQGRVKGLAVVMVFGLLIAGLGLSESRSGLLGAVALLLFALLCRKYALTRQSVWYAVAGFLLLLVCFKFLPLMSYQLQQVGTAETSQLSSNLGAGTRLTIWPQLLEASLQHPWLGWGLLQVPMAHNAVIHNYGTAEAFTYAHNVILDLILGVGYPLSAVIVGLFLLWTIRRLRQIVDASAWYCLALLVPLIVHSLLEFPFAYAYFLLPVALAIGVLEARLQPTRFFQFRLAYAVVAHTIFVLSLLWSVWEYINIEEDFRVARFEALRIGNTQSFYDRPTVVMFTQMEAVLAGLRLVPEPGMSAERIEAARKVALRFPWIATQNRYALSLALNGNTEEAVRQIKVMRAMYGEKTYEGIKSNWLQLASDKYPQLKEVLLP